MRIVFIDEIDAIVVKGSINNKASYGGIND